MTEFDPYRKWLGIPLEEQPPNHYRLLGIGLFESDSDVIANAADRQMVHVRSFQAGKFSDISQRLLNELSAARLCLLDQSKRAAYDAQLREKIAAVGAKTGDGRVVVPPEIPTEIEPPGYVSVDAIAEVAEVRSLRRKPRRKQSFPLGALVVAIGIVILVLGMLLWKMTEHGDDAYSNAGAGATGSTASDQPDAESWGKEPRSNGRDPKGSSKEPSNTKSGGATNKEKVRRPLPHQVGQLMGVRTPIGAVSAVAFAMIGDDVAFGGSASPAHVWDLGTGEKVSLKEGGDSVVSVALSPNGALLAAATGKLNPPSEGKLTIWKLPSHAVAAQVDLGNSLLAWSVRFSPDAKHVAVGCQDGSICLIDLANVKKRDIFPSAGAAIRSIAFMGNGKHLVSGGNDGVVRVWSVGEAKPLFELKGAVGAVTSVAVSLDGSRAASGGEDGLVRIWDLKAKRCLFKCKGHQGAVTGVDYASDGFFVISSGVDGTLRVWRAKDGVEVQQFQAHDNGAACVALSGPSRHAISGGLDGTVKVWGMPDVAMMPANMDGFGPVPEDRLAEPDGNAQAKVEEQIVEDVFKSEFEAAAKPGAKPEAKQSLAEKLLAEGTKPEADPVAAFVLLRLSRDMSADAGETEAALNSIFQLDKRYDVDGLTLKVAVLEKMAAGVMPLPKRKVLAQKILDTVEEAVTAKNLDAALGLAKLAREQGQKASDKVVAKQAAVREKELEQAKQKADLLKDAQATLDKTPDDPEANLLVGKFECFVKGDWKQGIAHLALASDDGLKSLAKKESSVSDEAADQLAMGNAWWDAGEKQAKEEHAAFRGRAAFWYQKAWPNLKGLERAKAEQRLKECGKEPSDIPAKGNGESLPITPP